MSYNKLLDLIHINEHDFQQEVLEESSPLAFRILNGPAEW
jgi:hypothetical protein